MQFFCSWRGAQHGRKRSQELSRRIASCKAALAAGNEGKAGALALAVRSRARQLSLQIIEAEASLTGWGLVT